MPLCFWQRNVISQLKGDGKPTPEWLSREDATSLIASPESIILTIIVDAKEGCDVMTANVLNTLIQTRILMIEEDKEKLLWRLQECWLIYWWI